MTPFSRQKDIEKRGNWLPKIIKESKNLRSQEKGLSSGSILNLYYDYFGDSWGYDSSLALQLNVFKMSQKFTKSDWLISFSIISQVPQDPQSSTVYPNSNLCFCSWMNNSCSGFSKIISCLMNVKNENRPTVWYKIFAGSNFCDLSDDSQNKNYRKHFFSKNLLQRKYSLIKFATQKYSTKKSTSTSTSTLFNKNIDYNRLSRKIVIADLGGPVKEK